MKRPFPVALAALMACEAAGVTLAQTAKTNTPAGPFDAAPFLAAALSEMLSDSRAFSAVAVVQLPGDAPGQGVPLAFATAEGKMRWQLNLDNARSQRLSQEITSLLREARLNQFVVTLRPNTNAIVSVPGMQSWCELPLPKTGELQEKAQTKVGFLQKTEVGRETVDGHSCVKYRLHIPGEAGQQEEAFVWQAADLRNLPVKLQVRVRGEQYGLLFRNIRYIQPDARLFDPPAGYTKLAGPEALLQAALLRSVAGSGPNDPRTTDLRRLFQDAGQ